MGRWDFGGGSVDEKRREEFVVAVEQMAIRLGAKSYEKGLDQAIRLVSCLLQLMESIRTKEALRTALDSLETPTKSEERKILFAIRYMPQFIRITSGLAITKFLTALPAFAPGRPQRMTAEEGEKLLNFISGLHRQGVPLGIAKQRAAARFHCSVRTVERLWGERGETREDCATPEEIKEWISTEI